MPTTITPFSHPLYVMLKPIGPHCNLACKYCYYLEKQHLYDTIPTHIMDDHTLIEMLYGEKQREYEAKRAPANVMEAIRTGILPQPGQKR